jgi:hypothetical protein
VSKEVNGIPFSIDSDAVMSELMSMYKNKLDAFRELTANSFDAEAYNVSIDLIDNQRIKIEDDGYGLQDITQYTTAGNLHKKTEKISPKLKRSLVGRKGLGRIAIAMLGDEAFISSNNGLRTINFWIKRIENNMVAYPTIPKTNIDDVRIQRGTNIVISKLKHSIDKSELTQYLSENLIGIMNPINAGEDKKYPLSIHINKRKISAFTLPSEKVGVHKTQIGDIQYWLSPKKSRQSIKILWRGVHVLNWWGVGDRPCAGIVNIDFLDPNPTRDEFKDTGEDKKLFYFQLETLIKKVIPKIKKDTSEALDKDAIQNLNNILRWLKEQGITFPKAKSRSAIKGDDEFGIIRSPKTSDSQSCITENEGIPKEKQDRVKSHTLYGVTLDQSHCGINEPVIVVSASDNTLIWNIDHPVTRQIRYLHSTLRKTAEYTFILEGIGLILYPEKNLNDLRLWRDAQLFKLFTKRLKKSDVTDSSKSQSEGIENE